MNINPLLAGWEIVRKRNVLYVKEKFVVSHLIFYSIYFVQYSIANIEYLYRENNGAPIYRKITVMTYGKLVSELSTWTLIYTSIQIPMYVLTQL